MNRFSFHNRAERVIAVWRVALAALSLLASWLDPFDPARYARIVEKLLSAYFGYALVVFSLLWIFRKLPGWWPVAAQVLDLAAFLVFMYFTAGYNSHFFVYFTFWLVCATLRWQWRGTVWTGAVAILVFLVMSFYASRIQRDPAFDLNVFIVRGAQLIVVTALISYLGAYQERLSAEKSRLAAWPQTEVAEFRTLVRELLEHAAAVLQSPRMLMIWEEPGEPSTRVACYSNGVFDLSDERLAAFGSLVARPLEGTSFFCLDAQSPATRVVLNAPGGARQWKGTPLEPGLQSRFNVRAVMSWGLAGTTIKGRLFALDKPGMSLGDVVLGEIVAGLAVTHLDHFALQERLREAAAMEERIRLSRDLHDGLLQSLTGVALQLQVSRRLLERDPEAAKERLREIQTSIANEQRDLRAFVNRLKPVAPDGTAGWNLRLRLEEICNRIERQWGLRVKLTTQGLAEDLPAVISDDASRILQEAMVNAARHAEASLLCVNVVREDCAVRMSVADDGHGFSFRGTYDLAALQRMKAGPITLKDRVLALGGGLVICSSESGARIDITLPLSRAQS